VAGILALGTPAKVVRTLSAAEREVVARQPPDLAAKAAVYRKSK